MLKRDLEDKKNKLKKMMKSLSFEKILNLVLMDIVKKMLLGYLEQIELHVIIIEDRNKI